MKMKEVLKKLLVSILIILTLCNFIISSGGSIGIVEASGDPEPQQTSTDGIDKIQEDAEELINSRNNGITGILTWLLKIVVIGIAATFQIETFFVANSAGNDGTLTSAFVTPLDIFFNRFTLVDVNIFSDKDAAGNELDKDGLVYSIRSNAAMWYYIFQSIAVAILLVVLIINGIKLLKNTADRLAEFKKLMFDWVVSFVLLIFLHMIIIAIIGVNETFVKVIEKAADTANVSSLMDSLMTTAFSENYLIGMASTIVYVMMVIQTIIYLFIYIKRFLTTVFLVIVSPLVTVTYSIDRADGGKAKALNGWLREFIYNVGVQTLHCIIYVVIVGIALSALNGVSVSKLENLGAAIIAILAMFFIKKAEELLRELFGFNNATTLLSHKNVVNSAVSIASTGYALTTGSRLPTGGMTFGQNVGENPSQPSFVENAGAYISQKISYAKSEYQHLISSEENIDEQTDNESRFLLHKNDEDETFSEEQTPVIGPGIPMIGIATLGDEIGKESENQIKEGMKELAKAVDSTKPKLSPTNENDGDKKEGDDESKNSEDLDLFEKLKNIEMLQNGLKRKQDMVIARREALDEWVKSGKIDSNDAKKVKRDFRNMSKSNPEEIDEYINSLDDQKLQEYARGILFLRKTRANINDVEATLKSKKEQWIDQAKAQGVEIDYYTEKQLMGGNSINRFKVSSDAIEKLKESTMPKANPGAGVGTNANSGKIAEAVKKSEDTSTTNNNNAEDDNETEIEIDLPNELRQTLDERAISNDAKDALKDRTVREHTKGAMNMIDVINGKGTIEADLTDESLTNFNVEILSKIQQGAYSESNFKAAEAKVKMEGNAAVRRLEAFRSNQTVANAKALTPAGQEYATLMLEAQQAGMLISTMRVSSEQRMQVDKNVTTTMHQENITPTNTTNNVINNLNSQKQAQG